MSGRTVLQLPQFAQLRSSTTSRVVWSLAVLASRFRAPTDRVTPFGCREVLAGCLELLLASRIWLENSRQQHEAEQQKEWVSRPILLGGLGQLRVSHSWLQASSA